jgi:hypothetical protein
VSCGPGQARWTSMHGRQTTRDDGVLIVRKLIAWVFLYSLDGWHNAYGRDDVDEAFTFLERSFSDCTSFMFELQAYDVVGDMAYTAGLARRGSVGVVPIRARAEGLRAKFR